MSHNRHVSQARVTHWGLTGEFEIGRDAKNSKHKVAEFLEAAVLSNQFDIANIQSIADDFTAAPHFIFDFDWTAVLRRFEGVTGAVSPLPYPKMTAEMTVNGVRVYALMTEPTDPVDVAAMYLFAELDHMRAIGAFAHERGEWHLQGPTNRLKPTFASFINKVANTFFDQAIAVSIFEQAGIVDTPLFKASEKLNSKRLQSGRAPISDYHLVRICRRQERDAANVNRSYKGVVRLHLRRGHWVSAHGKRFWRKWSLVGNPDLGFIEKAYLMGRQP
ncbi:MAG: hypothetical protein CMJ42_22770 [Phyllobacteriaceae bacterium]|nr:hypothetical protein [Phyllobacteriaceae bacterium]MBA89211.1 hypothetical protein [Phyllobacteriaceae bacterium]